METRENSTTRVELPAWDRNRVQTTTGRLVEQQHGSTLNQRAARRNPIVAGIGNGKMEVSNPKGRRLQNGLTKSGANWKIGSSGATSGRNTQPYANLSVAEHFVSYWLLLPV
jgi:hypothetical protein